MFMVIFGRKVSSFYILLFNILYLSVLHLRRMIYKYGHWGIEVDTLYMMSICKFSSIAFAYEDGGKKEDELKCTYHKVK
jgi:hypothetical protein